MNEVIISIRELTKSFGNFTAVNRISFDAVSYTHLTLPTKA